VLCLTSVYICALTQTDGCLFGGGWRPGRRGHEAAGEYSPQTPHDWHNPQYYIGYQEKQEPISVSPLRAEHIHVSDSNYEQVGWIVLHQRLSPYAVMKNVNTLADTAVPLFGYHDSDITVSGPNYCA
jgi:hypothetical protein